MCVTARGPWAGSGAGQVMIADKLSGDGADTIVGQDAAVVAEVVGAYVL